LRTREKEWKQMRIGKERVRKENTKEWRESKGKNKAHLIHVYDSGE
jgi:hypothetical protein